MCQICEEIQFASIGKSGYQMALVVLNFFRYQKNNSLSAGNWRWRLHKRKCGTLLDCGNWGPFRC